MNELSVKRWIAATAVVLGLLFSGGRSSENAFEWKLVWSDEFDGPAGQSPDSSRWRFDIGTGWGNAQLEYDTDRPQNVSLDGETGYSGGNAMTGKYTLPEGSFNDDYHVFAVEWDGTRIAWFMDEIKYQTITVADLPSGSDWVFDHPFLIILNVAVGGHFVGAPNEATTFPQTMLVDWVRVYRGES